jgi:hypothetical protein
VLWVGDKIEVAAVDVRIETFMRDIASDKGKSARVVAENARQRLGLLIAAARKESDPHAADRNERRLLADLERRVSEEMERYRGTGSEQHYALVLQNLNAPAAAAAA